jgi:hypothetical protein
MATRLRFEGRLIGLGRHVLRKLSRRRESAPPSVYIAFSIGPEELAISVRELDAESDEDALKKATPLFHDGLKHIEVWCGSRKVADIPPSSDHISDSETIRDSA